MNESDAVYYDTGVALARLATFVSLDMRDILAGIPPLTIGRLRILILLRLRSRQLSEIAEIERIRLPTASTKISRMAKEGLVARTKDENDQRAKLISLTPLGRDYVRRGVQAIDAFLDRCLRSLSDEEIAQAAVLVPRLASVFQGENVVLFTRSERDARRSPGLAAARTSSALDDAASV